MLTVLASYHWLGFLTGDDTVQVGRTASLFYANFHFISTGTNYLGSQAPPSALQNFWSLSVEEQFYVLYPTLFIVAALAWSRVNLPPFRWLGKLSYSLYLWHWPVVIIPAQYAGHSLSVKDNLGWVLLALAFSIVSYFVVENPLRHWKYLSRSGIRSLGLGALFIGASLGLMAFETGTHP